MKGRAIAYGDQELAWLEANQTLPISEYAAAFNRLFGRDVSAAHLHALRKRKGWRTGRTGHFVKGEKPHNKGRQCAPGTGGRHPNSRRTQFKKGAQPHTFRGVGHERIDAKDGYVIMIVAETNPWTGAATRPVHKHRYLWERQHGPLPRDHCLKCLDGNKTNTDPSNWEAIPRAVLARLNGGRQKKRIAYDEAPEELKPAVLALAKLEHLTRERRKALATADGGVQ